MNKVVSPYRTPAEKDPEPKRATDWEPIIAAIIAVIVVLGMISLSIHGCLQKEAKAEQKADMKKKRANTCGFIDVERGFRIDSYDGEGNGRVEGFFSTRKEADDFKDNLPRCKGK